MFAAANSLCNWVEMCWKALKKCVFQKIYLTVCKFYWLPLYAQISWSRILLVILIVAQKKKYISHYRARNLLHVQKNQLQVIILTHNNHTHKYGRTVGRKQRYERHNGREGMLWGVNILTTHSCRISTGPSTITVKCNLAHELAFWPQVILESTFLLVSYVQ